MDVSPLHRSAEDGDSKVHADLTDRLMPALLAVCFGLLLVYVAGFAGIEALHNAAHDTRHAAAFPCH
jgi:cobalt transporter subunit CbtB